MPESLTEARKKKRAGERETDSGAARFRTERAKLEEGRRRRDKRKGKEERVNVGCEKELEIRGGTDSAHGMRGMAERGERGKVGKEEERRGETRTSKGEKTARPTTVRALRPAAVAKPVLRLHSLFIRRVARRGGSNERSLLGRAPTDESTRAPPGWRENGGDHGDLHPLCVISLRY